MFIFGFLIAKDTLNRIYQDISIQKSQSSTVSVETQCDETCRAAISNEVGRAVATISASNKNIVIQNAGPGPQTSYIPLDGSFSTMNTDWTDAPGIEASFDLAKDYPPGSKVSWEASLRVTNANGTAYARLFDVAHGIAVDGSEISVTNSADYQHVSSGNLNLWSGRNIYRVQIKSLNSFNVDYTAGKIKISN